MQNLEDNVTHYFFNSTIGIVRVDNSFEVKYYIKAISGRSLAHDIIEVAKWGNTFPKEAGEALFDNGYMTPNIYK